MESFVPHVGEICPSSVTMPGSSSAQSPNWTDDKSLVKKEEVIPDSVSTSEQAPVKKSKEEMKKKREDSNKKKIRNREHAKNHKSKKRNESTELSISYDAIKAEYERKRKFVELLDMYKKHMGKEFVSKRVFN